MNIALLIEDGSTASSIATTLDMLRLAERFHRGPAWKLIPCSAHGGTVRLNELLQVETQRLPASLGHFDVIILPGFFAESVEGVTQGLRGAWRHAIDRLRHLPESTLLAASCYGTFVLAEAGALNGLPATTTWWFAAAFRQRYAAVRLDADAALVDSGRVITAGAMTAHADLVLHVLRRLGGPELARQVANIMLVDGARDSQRPFMSVQRDFHDPLVTRAIDWLAHRLAQSVTMDELAEAMHTSYRTLNRRFTRVAGMTPLACLQALRVDHAKALLAGSGEGLETITARVGYGDVSSFRRLFKRTTGLSPQQYRRQFGRNHSPRQTEKAPAALGTP